MTQAIVTYLNAVIDTVGRVDERYCMAELRSDGTTTVPYTYVGSGKVKPISIDSGSLSYWRISGAVPPMEQIASQYGKPRLSATYPLRLVIIARRADSTVDDGFMPTRLAEDIANALTGSHPDLKLLLKANTVSVSAGYDVNITSVWADEFKGTGVNDPNYTRTIMALSVSVTVVGDRACWENECDYDPDILHLFDFCQAGTVARLTDAQVTCLQDALCEACEDATVTVNTTPFGTAPSGGTLDVPVVNNGANPVGSKQGSDWVIANNATLINGTQVTDQEAEVDANIFVTLDGTQSGSWNAGLQTWEVTGVACADANLEINGVQQETIASGATFNLIATLDGVAGGSYNAGTNTLSFTSNTGWQPDPNWPVLPSLTAADERFVGTLAVFENSYNVVSVSATNLAASSNWGDGTPATVSNGSPQFHVYDYATIAATVYTFQGRNVKYVTLDITRVGGAITFLSFYNASTINAGGGNNFVDIIMSIPNSTIGSAISGLLISGFKPMSLLQRIRVKAVGANAAAFYQGTLRGMESLRVLEWPYSTLGQYQNFSNASGQVDDLGDIDWGVNTTMTSAFATSHMKRHGNLTANSATTSLVGYAVDCQRLEEFGTINAAIATSLATFFGSSTGSPVLTRVGLITAPLCQNLSSFAFRCYALGELIFSDCAAVTNTANMVTNCPALYNLVMPNLTRGVNMASSAMGNYGMSNFANSIGTATGAQTITVTGTPFGALLTALDATALAIRLVMTGKGYTVAN